MISVNSMGEASWESEFPKPRMHRPAQSTAEKVSEWTDREENTAAGAPLTPVVFGKCVD